MTGRCDNCLYWKDVGDGAGECRRRAPAPVLGPPPSQSIMLPVVWWPPMRADDWCGEHQPLPVRPDGPTIVCLCGSIRFSEAYRTANRDETLAGRIVLSIGFVGNQEGLDMDGSVKTMLDELHLAKIDRADEVLILDVDGYIGASTLLEITYAQAHGKRIRYLSQESPELARSSSDDETYLAQLQRDVITPRKRKHGKHRGRLQINAAAPVLQVRFHELESRSDLACCSLCPACRYGVLLMRRNPETMTLLAEDVCDWCGQRVVYEDIDLVRNRDGRVEP